MTAPLFTHPPLVPGRGEYVATVQIVRNMGDDLDVLSRKAAGVDTGQALAAQVAAEIQTAFDNWAAGRFQVTDVRY